MTDPRPAMSDELHRLVDVVARKPNGVRALGMLIDLAMVLAAYKANRPGISGRARRKPEADSFLD